MKNILSLLLLLSACTVLNAQQLNNVVAKSQIVITHSNSLIVETETSISCNTLGITHENSYYRVFDLYNDFFINADWNVENIVLGAALVEAGQLPEFSAIIKFYTMSAGSPLVLDSLTLIGQQDIVFDNEDDEVLLNFEITGQVVIQKNMQLVVELFIPDGQDDEDYFFIASNSLGQTDPSYIRAPFCEQPVPINISEIGHPDMHIIMEVYGQYTLPNPEMLSFNIPGQITETIITNDPDYTVSLIMPADSLLTDLEPEILVPAGFHVNPASGDIVDFSQGTVEYTVSNELKKVSQSWMVSVLHSTPDILSFSMDEQMGETLILGKPDFTVDLLIHQSVDLTDLVPEIEIYSDFVISPASGVSQDFSEYPVIYTVSHKELPISQEWTADVSQVLAAEELVSKKFTIIPNPACDFFRLQTNFSFKDNYNLEIFNTCGGKVFSAQIPEYNSKGAYEIIELTNIPDGLYIVRVYSGRKIYSSKLVVSNQ